MAAINSNLHLVSVKPSLADRYIDLINQPARPRRRDRQILNACLKQTRIAKIPEYLTIPTSISPTLYSPPGYTPSSSNPESINQNFSNNSGGAREPTVTVVDVSLDLRFKLICDLDHTNPRYEEHDGTALNPDEEIPHLVVKQYHMNASVIRDANVLNAGMLPIQVPSPNIWQRLASKSRLFPIFTYPSASAFA